MDDQFNEWGKVKWAFLAALGLSELVGVLAAASHGGLWLAAQVAGGILLLYLLLFGAYYLWRRTRARRRRQIFSAAIQAQATLAPRSVSDPNERAALDRLRQKFQTGVNEFTSRGRDIYKLPWYVFIGEPGSGKTEAIRHSGIDFPPGMQNELQGSGGTVNMDWWFTNHGIILDTAGRLLFSETPIGQTPEWGEFLRLLRKTRSHCPINGLFIALSVESLIKDSADRIVQKASRLAQQLDLIQRTLDVRFPVYLLVSKCDLLTGFRDFFENIDNPLLQHQMFGWSNPDPLDAPFRPELVDQHLETVVERLRRRRMALLRDSLAQRLDRSGLASRLDYGEDRSHSEPRRAADVESLFALPESIMRLAPRLRRYLEALFVTGEWSAKPVFLRGIYFTSSMRQGKALDEAIALATGLPLDQLPEEGNWEKERAFFLRDMFLEKVFREPGLVTRAISTAKLLRARSLAFYAASAAAFLLFLGFATYGYSSLNASVRREAGYWRYAAEHWNAWSPGLVSGPNEQWQFVYSGGQPVECRIPLLDRKPSLIEYHRFLQNQTEQPLRTGWIFQPMARLIRHREVERDRQLAQRLLFENWIVKPLVSQTRMKMVRPHSLVPDPGAMARHEAAWVALLQLEAEGAMAGARQDAVDGRDAPRQYLGPWLSYLVGCEVTPDPLLLRVWEGSYGPGRTPNQWPPKSLLFGDSLSKNTALAVGLAEYQTATTQTQTNLFREVAALDEWVDQLNDYLQKEHAFLSSRGGVCQALNRTLLPLKTNLATRTEHVRSLSGTLSNALTNLNQAYLTLSTVASNSSVAPLLAALNETSAHLPNHDTTGGLIQDVRAMLQQLGSQTAAMVKRSYGARLPVIAILERDQLASVEGEAAFEARWRLYTAACELASMSGQTNSRKTSDAQPRPGEWDAAAAQFRAALFKYHGPFADEVKEVCNRIIAAAGRTDDSVHGLEAQVPERNRFPGKTGWPQ